MLATLTDDYFSDPGWIFGRKLDGERCLAYRKGGKVKLGSRNKKDISSKYPELVAEIAFTEWAEDGKLRHPRYQGLRDDKDPKDVKREKPQNA